MSGFQEVVKVQDTKENLKDGVILQISLLTRFYQLPNFDKELIRKIEV